MTERKRENELRKSVYCIVYAMCDIDVCLCFQEVVGYIYDYDYEY